MGISQYTFIKKERRAEWDRIPEQHRQEERLLLWQGDRGNAAAEVILLGAYLGICICHLYLFFNSS